MDWGNIICAIIAAGGSLVGVIISNNRSNAKIKDNLSTWIPYEIIKSLIFINGFWISSTAALIADK